MSVRDVVDMLALAQRGINSARMGGDTALLELSNSLALKALNHPDAAILMTAVSQAAKKVKESPFGNDPDLEDNGNGIFNPEGEDTGDGAEVEDREQLMQEQQQQPQQGQPQEGEDPNQQQEGEDPNQQGDQDVDEESPAASPAYEGVTDGEEEDDMDENKRGQAATSGITRNLRYRDLVSAAASNLAALNKPSADRTKPGRVLVYNAEGRAVGDVDMNATGNHAEKLSGVPMKFKRLGKGNYAWVPAHAN